MNKQINKIPYFFVLALTVGYAILLVNMILQLNSAGEPFYQPVMLLVNIVGILFYLLWGYKKAHGNLLKYLFLVFSFIVAILGLNNYTDCHLIGYCLVLAAMIISHLSGRLHRVDNNIVLSVVVLVYLLLAAGEFVKDGVSLIIALSFPLEWIVLDAIYFVRYKAHKAAGIADDGKTA